MNGKVVFNFMLDLFENLFYMIFVMICEWVKNNEVVIKFFCVVFVEVVDFVVVNFVKICEVVLKYMKLLIEVLNKIELLECWIVLMKVVFDYFEKVMCDGGMLMGKIDMVLFIVF